MFTHPQSTVSAISDNSTIWSRISLERIKQSTSVKQHYQPRQKKRSTKRSTKKLVLMFTHPKWTLRVLGSYCNYIRQVAFLWAAEL